MDVVENYKKVKAEIETINKKTNIIVVSKTFQLEILNPLLELGHLDFGENKVQEAIKKWSNLKKTNNTIRIHLIGKLQRNKVKYIFDLFDFVHSLDSFELADELNKYEKLKKKKISYFIQINFDNELQKSGIKPSEFESFLNYCKNKASLNVIGLMCIPPFKKDPLSYFKYTRELAFKHNISNLSMGMSNDFQDAINFGSTHVRVGTIIFGNRLART